MRHTVPAGHTRVTFVVPIGPESVRNAIDSIGGAIVECGDGPREPSHVLWSALKAAELEYAPREELPRATEKKAPPRGTLSDRAELLLGLVREGTELAADGEVLRYFVPPRDPVSRIYGQAIPFPGFKPSGSGDASILRSLERRGLIKAERINYSFSATVAGVAAYDEIKKRREAGVCHTQTEGDQ